ncbi:hypothetical protein CSCA_2498 [Clostridium scatologenes]|uniref:Uncharacterized protein n=1 Tax=Clostridium scatologenes TaxID=1548 RepID=A0A0E3JNT7_CLOSL|nr:hypothetical protein CSCA_2498 [Clostridium scatologenes]
MYKYVLTYLYNGTIILTSKTLGHKITELIQNTPKKININEILGILNILYKRSD